MPIQLKKLIIKSKINNLDKSIQPINKSAEDPEINRLLLEELKQEILRECQDMIENFHRKNQKR